MVRVQITDASGKERSEYARSLLARNGRAGADVPLALNDPAGTWKVTATDVATGQRGTAGLPGTGSTRPH